MTGITYLVYTHTHTCMHRMRAAFKLSRISTKQGSKLVRSMSGRLREKKHFFKAYTMLINMDTKAQVAGREYVICFSL